MSRKSENAGFRCQQCGCRVEPLTNGSCRNHCPACLYSRHVDVVPGDRASLCGGPMEAISVVWKSGKGWQIVHRCLACGHMQANRVAADCQQPDDWELIARLSVSP